MFAMMYVAIDVFSTKTPFHVFVNNFTFSRQSAYNRILIFEFGSAEVAVTRSSASGWATGSGRRGCPTAWTISGW
jgi:hypothetical protein